MRDEADAREPQQRVVPSPATPTRTASIHQTAINKLGSPATTAGAKELETSIFVLGTDTCGFATDSIITCDPGNECINIDSYRGCCAIDGTDCSATIFTDCLDYVEMPDAAMCGPQTLCCPSTEAYCATYGFITEEQPPCTTFTLLRCAESPVLGELYTSPPGQEQETTTEATSIESTSSTLAVDPVRITHSSSPHSVSSGTIAGAAVGGFIFLLLAIVGIFQIINRRPRQAGETTRSGGGDNSTPGLSAENTGFGNSASAGHLSSLFMINEQQTDSPLSTSPRDRRRPSFGPNWPLGPISPRNPLSSHPVVDVEKRFSWSDSSSQTSSDRHRKISAPTLRIPTPTLLGSHLTPPPLKKPKSPQVLFGDSQTSTKGSALQSPRLSCIPPPAVYAAFEEGVEKTPDDGGEPSTNSLDETETSSSTVTLPTATTSLPKVADTTAAMDNKGLTENGLQINEERSSSSSNDWHPSESPSALNIDTRGGQQPSLVPTPHIPHNRSQGELSGSVSPISSDGSEGRLSPTTVSPLESRDGSPVFYKKTVE